jgi:hypothetical protein
VGHLVRVVRLSRLSAGLDGVELVMCVEEEVLIRAARLGVTYYLFTGGS